MKKSEVDKRATKSFPKVPVNLFLEGNDQFRGWFNSSLIISTILTGLPPYQQVVTHGFVVDEKGRKMSKSLGNVLQPEQILAKFPVDIARLWVASSDFTKEIKVNFSLLEEIAGNYQKIRNTFRFLLANLYWLREKKQLVKKLEPIDHWVLFQLAKLREFAQTNYSNYSFNLIYQALLNFCINDLSSFYFEISKDSLYCDSSTSLRRKQISTVLYYILGVLLKIINPLVPFLAEEIYQNIPFQFSYGKKKASSLFLTDLTLPLSSKTKKGWKLVSQFLPLRQEVFNALEKARQAKVIQNNSQARVLVVTPPNFSQADFVTLRVDSLLLVAQVEFSQEPPPTDSYQGTKYWIKISKTSYSRCLRCWSYQELIGEFCSRCDRLLKKKNAN